jgi:hypothetical protein
VLLVLSLVVLVLVQYLLTKAGAGCSLFQPRHFFVSGQVF